MEFGVIVSDRESETAREDDLGCWASFTYINYPAEVYNEICMGHAQELKTIPTKVIILKINQYL